MDDARPPRRPRAPRENNTGFLIQPPGASAPVPTGDDSRFVVRLDPNAAPGEFNFVIEGDAEQVRHVPMAPVELPPGGGIPAVMQKAVDEVLGFIYELDTEIGDRAKKPRRD